MEILKAVLFLVIGFILLVKGADFFVNGASDIARKLRIPTLIIGLTIVAMGTSLPELSVSVTAALGHANSLAFSNVVGSNIFNLMVVLGVCAVIAPVAVNREVTRRDYPISILCAVLLLVLGVAGMSVGHVEGVILLICFAGYLFITIRSALQSRNAVLSGGTGTDVLPEEAESGTEEPVLPMWRAILYVVLGAAAVKFGGDFTVDGAVAIARMLGVTETLIGLTIVACGTSLPELVTSIVAARRNELDMAVGNVVGSNIFNILMILGISAAITPVAVITENLVDTAVLIAFSAIVWIFCATKHRIGRKEGIAMLVMYAAYLVYICIR